MRMSLLSAASKETRTSLAYRNRLGMLQEHTWTQRILG